MTLQESISDAFSKYATFEGRSPRSAYWYFVLFTTIVSIMTGVVDAALFPYNELSPISTLFSLAILLPAISLTTRRLHDSGRSGWWQLIMLTIIGIIVLIVWMCQKSDPVPNQYG